MEDFFGMMVFIIWIIGSIAVAAVGDARKIGAGWAFLLCLFLTPFFTVFIVLLSKDKQTDRFEKDMLELMKKITDKTNNDITSL